MTVRKVILINLFCCIIIFLCNNSFAQIKQGKITYERKTNLQKKYKNNDWIEGYINKIGKIKVDNFELYFNDTASAFVFPETDIVERMSWLTSKNKIYINQNNKTQITCKEIWGEKVWLKDSLNNFTWKITESKRTINGFNCRKAIWQKNDSSKIYAWYSEDISNNIGPEGFYNLPGAILGLATENGGIIYFASKVETITVSKDLITADKKIKYQESNVLKKDLEARFGKEPWGKRMIKDLFSTF